MRVARFALLVFWNHGGRRWSSQRSLRRAQLSLSKHSPAGSNAFTQDPEAHSSALSKNPMLALSSSEEVDITSIEAGDLENLPPLSSAYA